jgi:hypothetical protein
MSEVFLDFCRFCQAVFSRWVALLTGGIIAFGWLIYSQWTGGNVPMTAFYCIALVTLLFACFGAWREQYLKNKIENLRGQIMQVGLGEGLPHGGAWITIILRLTNSGPPTIASGFIATVKSGSFCQNLSPMTLPEATRFHHEGGMKQIKPSDLIHEKLTKAIPQGESVTGYLVYIAPNASAHALNDDWPQITITFRDASGREYKVTNGQETDTPLHITGVHDPFGNVAERPKRIS